MFIAWWLDKLHDIYVDLYRSAWYGYGVDEGERWPGSVEKREGNEDERWWRWAVVELQ